MATAPGDHTMYFVFDDKMINYHRIYKVNFLRLIKLLLDYILYKICKHSLNSIDFIASVYELFNNPRIPISKAHLSLWLSTICIFQLFATQPVGS